MEVFSNNVRLNTCKESVEITGYAKPPLDDGGQHINGHDTPYLRLRRVLLGTEERIDVQVLHDPFEKEFHPPAMAIEVGYGRGSRSGWSEN